MTLGALVKVRRDRLNIVSGDHYTPMWTDEIFKLNRGATRVEFRIDAVSEIGRHDPAGAAPIPDFYPVFIYPESTPLLYQVRAERNIQFPNRKALSLRWPGYKLVPQRLGNGAGRLRPLTTRTTTETTTCRTSTWRWAR